MPGDDLLRFIGGPDALSAWWSIAALVLVLAVVGWCIALVVWTLPPARLRRIPLLRNVHAALTRRRFRRTIQATTRSLHERTLSPAEASAAYGRAVRSFLFVRTGIRAQYLHLSDIAETDGDVARAVPLLAALHDAQFNAESRGDVTALGRSAEELVSSWT